MKHLLSLPALLLIAGLAAAQPPHFFIAGMLQWSEPTSEFGKESENSGNGNAGQGWGGEADIGLISDNGATYIGYRTTDFSEEMGDGPEWGPMNRFVAGLRWHVLGTLQDPVVPVLGAGVSLGKSRLKNPYTDDPNIPSNQIDVESKTSFGWFAEGGLKFRLSEVVSLLGTLQYHEFGATFEDAALGDETKKYDVTYLTGQAGLQFLFR
jgi:opacity protein-like surface antigen